MRDTHSNSIDPLCGAMRDTHSNSFDTLCEVLRDSGLRVTFDSGRNNTHPCTFCGGSDGPRKLRDIGTYPNGATLTRPVCERCDHIVDTRKPAANNPELPCGSEG